MKLSSSFGAHQSLTHSHRPLTQHKPGERCADREDTDSSNIHKYHIWKQTAQKCQAAPRVTAESPARLAWPDRNVHRFNMFWWILCESMVCYFCHIRGSDWPVSALITQTVRSRAAQKIVQKIAITHSDSEAFYISSWITNKCSYFPPGFFEAPPNAALPLPPPSTCGKASLQHVIQWRKPACSWVFGRSEWEAVFRRGSKPPICPSFWRLGPRF